MSLVTTRPVLVTGATGYIGSRIVIDLLNRGYTVRGSMRNREKADRVAAAIADHAPTSRLSFVEADLMRADDWPAAVSGVDYILHVASPFFAALPEDPNDLIRPAREGTLHILQAATREGSRRLVLTSSVAAAAYGLDATPSEPITEQRWTDLYHPDTTPYVQSKTLAELAARDFVTKTRNAPQLVSVNPGVVLGPAIGDNLSDSLLVVLKMLRGEFPGIPPIGFQVVDVRDVADLHLRAMEQDDAAGHRFLGTAGYLELSEVSQLLLDHFPEYKRKIPKINFPAWLVRLAANFDADTRGVLNELGVKRLISSAKAKDQLGWQPRPPEEAVLATARDLIAKRLI